MPQIKVDDKEYKIMATPPHLAPYAARIGELLQMKPASKEEAEKASVELKEMICRFFEETCSPPPLLEHQTQVYKAIIAETNKLLSEAEFFRRARRSDSDKGSAGSSPNKHSSQ